MTQPAQGPDPQTLKDARDEFVAALKDAGVDILTDVKGNLDDFLQSVATQAVGNALAGSARGQRHVRAQMLLAKMDAKLDMEETAFNALVRLVQMGGRIAGGFLGLGITSLLGDGGGK